MQNNYAQNTIFKFITTLKPAISTNTNHQFLQIEIDSFLQSIYHHFLQTQTTHLYRKKIFIPYLRTCYRFITTIKHLFTIWEPMSSPWHHWESMPVWINLSRWLLPCQFLDGFFLHCIRSWWQSWWLLLCIKSFVGIFSTLP